MKRMWAPWRMQYIHSGGAKKGKGSCFFCEAVAGQNSEREHLLLKRGKWAIIMLNRFPYNVGHTMVAPIRHIGNFEEINDEEVVEIWALIAETKCVLQQVMNANGVNIGFNQGKCAGAGVLDHLHAHIVPRWEGDTNFMPVLNDCRVMSQALLDCYDKLLPKFDSRE